MMSRAGAYLENSRWRRFN